MYDFYEKELSESSDERYLYIKINEGPRTTLVASGEKLYVIVTDSSLYAVRYDMIAVVVGNQALPPIIFTPQYRRARNMKGINGDMLVNFYSECIKN